jgi:hypothetical protein
MTDQNKINTMDEALRVLWLENSQSADFNISENELELILASDDVLQMDQQKQCQLIDKLFNTIKSISLGELISEAFKSKALSEEAVAQETRLPMKVIEELKTDSVFPNNIPVLLLKGLFNNLDISYKAAEQSILKTFEIMRKKKFINLEPGYATMAFRKSGNDIKGSLISRNKVDGSELYENKDALVKYLSKLEDLMK